MDSHFFEAVEMPQRTEAEGTADKEPDKTTQIRIDRDLKLKIGAIVKHWQRTKPAQRKLNEAQYLARLLGDAVEHDFAEMVREQQAEINNRRQQKSRPRS